MKLEEFLSEHHVSFQKMPHQPAYTANRIAQALHVPGREVAKSVLLRTGHGHVLAVVPATHRVDLDEIRDCLGEETVEMAPEEDMEQLFPDCERGAIPPFGSMYHLPTIVDQSLAKDEEIVFEGQSHEEAIRMSYRDYEALENPRMGQFAHRR
jgi:Ala-tRNA(Pro) deacylase